MNTTSSPETPQTVIVTTKNTASLTLGIIAIVVGVLSLLVGWVPFLGLLAMPTAFIGLLIAGVGFLIALCKRGKGVGMPVLGGLICLAALMVPVLSTGGTSVALTKAVQAESNRVAAVVTNRPAERVIPAETPPSPVALPTKSSDDQEVKAAYIREHVVLYEVKVEYMTPAFDDRVPGVTFKLRNTGSRDLDLVKVTVFFKDATGAVIHEDDFYPVQVTTISLGDNKPLKAGYIWQMESGRFYAAKSVPSEWQEGSAEVRVTDIRFSK
ncbi:MAG TPA: hypothetical protein PKJ98_04730 [Verrucomicrobiota bacterium]|nr:hypothetical protein [Verrucomicrobiota bacterium]